MRRNSKSVRRCKRKTSQNKPENQVFCPILTISLEQNKKCQISDAVHCIPSPLKVSNQFYHISGGYVQKTTQKQPEMVLSANKRTFEISKLQNYVSHVYETWTDMYHLNTFHLHRNEGGSKWVGGGSIQNTIKKCYEINEISTLTSSYNSLENAMKVGIFLR